MKVKIQKTMDVKKHALDFVQQLVLEAVVVVVPQGALRQTKKEVPAHQAHRMEMDVMDAEPNVLGLVIKHVVIIALALVM